MTTDSVNRLLANFDDLASKTDDVNIQFLPAITFIIGRLALASNGIYAGLFASGFLLDRYMGHYKRRDGLVRIENWTFIVGATVSELVLLVFPRRLDRLERAPGWHH